MLKYLFPLLVVFTLQQGCSFTSPTQDKKIPLVKKEIELSKNQKELLAAIEQNNLDDTKNIVKVLTSTEKSFAASSDTPMGIALRNESVEIINILIQYDISIFELGVEKNQFNAKAIEVLFAESAQSLNLAFKAAPPLNTAQKALLDIYLNRINEAKKPFDLMLKSTEGVSLSQFQSNCELVEATLLLNSIRHRLNFDSASALLKRSDCSSNISVSAVTEIYHLELARLFQNYFDDASTLRYITHLENFSNVLWNIDSSGIFVSPKLLMRIAFSSANRFGSKNRYEVREQVQRDEILEHFFKEADFTSPEQELIYTVDGNLIYSFKYFPQQTIDGSTDAFFQKVSAYLHGKKLFVTTSDPKNAGEYIETEEEVAWHLTDQIWEDDVSDQKTIMVNILDILTT